MCRFTRLFWTQCGHSTLSNTPEHTQLCDTARDPDEEIRQGFDKAPAFCHPLPEDLEELGTTYRESDRVAQTNCVFAVCDACKQDPDFSFEPRGAGSEIEKPVERFEEYTDEDGMDVAKWRDLLLSDITQAEAAVREFEEMLVNDRENSIAAIQSISNSAVRRALLDPEGPERWAVFRRSHQETERLLVVVESLILMRIPRKCVNDLIEVVQDKIYQAGLRLSIFKVLANSIENHKTDPEAYEAALNAHADKLATRLGAPVVPDPETFSHLTSEMPQHVQDTIATRENVRRLSVEEHASAPRAVPYTPRSAFELGKNAKDLAIDVERAWNPPPERTTELPKLRALGENVDVVYDAELETRASLRHMGVGTWTEEQMQAQRETLRRVPGEQAELDDNDETLVESPKRPGKIVSSPQEKVRMVEKEATFMGMPLEDTDDEVSDAEDGDQGREADRQDGGQELVKTDVDKAERKRDENGRFVKKRKCSA